jgi:hypothetical protein
MALFTLVSGAGSPGVTTTAVGLALTWPRPVVLVEADPTGSSGILAGFFRGVKDHVGLVDLLMAHRSGLLAEALPRMVMEVPGTEVSILVGAKSHEQAGGLARLWEPLLGVLRDIAADGQDVIVDAGRLGLAGWPAPLVSHADVAVLATRSSLPALVAARSWASALAADVLPGHSAGVALVGAGRPYQPREVSRTLGLPVLGAVAWDPRRAAVYSEGADRPKPRFGGLTAAERAFERSGYVTGLRSLGDSMRSAGSQVSKDPFLRGLLAARIGEETNR